MGVRDRDTAEAGKIWLTRLLRMSWPAAADLRFESISLGDQCGAVIAAEPAGLQLELREEEARLRRAVLLQVM